jgi:hypothetical protein
LRAEFEDTPFAAGSDEPANAEEVMAEEARRRLEHMDDLDRWSLELEVSPVRTLRDVLEFMTAGSVLTKAGDEAILQLNAGAPLPGNVLSLSDHDRRVDDDLRWQRLHEPAAAAIDLFDPDGAAAAALRTSLQRLSRQIGIDAESVRAGILNLLQDGDFGRVSRYRARPGAPGLELMVDWESSIGHASRSSAAWRIDLPSARVSMSLGSPHGSRRRGLAVTRRTSRPDERQRRVATVRWRWSARG